MPRFRFDTTEPLQASEVEAAGGALISSDPEGPGAIENLAEFPDDDSAQAFLIGLYGEEDFDGLETYRDQA